MEHQLALEETVSVFNGMMRRSSSRPRDKKPRGCKTESFVFIAVFCIAMALVVLTFSVNWHVYENRTLENSIASSSFKFCGNQSVKVCLQDPECSLARTRRLVNGKVARNHTWPWMAEIVYERKHFCGAVLISADALVTAAHCFFDDENRLYEDSIEVRIGGRRRLSNDKNTQILRVSNIYIHHSFELSSLENDIAILKLAAPVQLTRSVWPICLASRTQGTIARSKGIMIGWGKTRKSGPFSSLLRESSVPVVPVSKCILANRGLFHGVEVSERNHICVGYGRSRPDYGCNGDSGGPLMIQSNSNKWTLLGVMSWGEPQCSAERTNSYTVFTNISPYMHWIEDLL